MPPLSRYGRHVFLTYTRLAGWRSSGASGADPITPDLVRQLEELYAVKVPLFVVELIFEIDKIFRRAYAAQLEKLGTSGHGEGAGVEGEEP
jgi:hypothetical protein